jgi:hypothetical protein
MVGFVRSRHMQEDWTCRKTAAASEREKQYFQAFKPQLYAEG